MSVTNRYPEVEGLFTWPSDEPGLIGAWCAGCETVFFPSFAEYHRPGCDGGPVEVRTLSRRGSVVSWTVQHYPPPPPFPQSADFEPITLVTVALPEGIQVPGHLVDCAPDRLRMGLSVELVVDTLYVDESGGEALTWKFRPAIGADDEER